MKAMESGIMDSSASSLCGSQNGLLIWTGEASKKTNQVPMGQIVSATEGAKLSHDLWNPA